MHISIIIPAWNDRSVLGTTLKSLSELDFNKKCCQLIIVAGGKDGTFEYAISQEENFKHFGKFLVVEQEPNGKNEALKKGIEHIDGSTELVVMVDADTKVDKYWLTKMVKCFNNSDYDAVNGDYRSIRKDNYISAYFLINKIRAHVIMKSTSLYGGGTIAFKYEILNNRDIYENLFPSDVFVGVDFNFSNVLKKNNYKLGFAEKAYVYTYLPYTLSEFIKNEGRWALAMISLNHMKKGFKLRLLKICSLFIPPIIFLVISAIYPSLMILFSILNVPLVYYILKSFNEWYSAYKISEYRIFLWHSIGYVFLNLINEFLIIQKYIGFKLGLYKSNKFFKRSRA